MEPDISILRKTGHFYFALTRRHARHEDVSSLVRNVPLFTSLEVSPFFALLLSLGPPSERSLRRGLSGAFRAKRRRRPQRVLTFAFVLSNSCFLLSSWPSRHGWFWSTSSISR